MQILLIISFIVSSHILFIVAAILMKWNVHIITSFGFGRPQFSSDTALNQVYQTRFCFSLLDCSFSPVAVPEIHSASAQNKMFHPQSESFFWVAMLPSSHFSQKSTGLPGATAVWQRRRWGGSLAMISLRASRAPLSRCGNVDPSLWRGNWVSQTICSVCLLAVSKLPNLSSCSWHTGTHLGTQKFNICQLFHFLHPEEPKWVWELLS